MDEYEVAKSRSSPSHFEISAAVFRLFGPRPGEAQRRREGAGGGDRGV